MSPGSVSVLNGGHRTADASSSSSSSSSGLRAASQSETPTGPIRFENVSAQSGLTFVLDQHATPEKNMVETMAGGVAVFDYDGDGLPDIYFTNGALDPVAAEGEPG